MLGRLIAGFFTYMSVRIWKGVNIELVLVIRNKHRKIDKDQTFQ